MSIIFAFILSAHQLQRYREGCQQFLAERGINVEEGRARQPVRAVLPRMVGSALDYDVAFLESDFAVLQYQYDLALNLHHVIDGPRAVHDRSLSAGAGGIDFQESKEVTRGRHDCEVAFIRLRRL